MAISAHWADDTQRLLWCKFESGWTWDDFYRIVASGQKQIARMPHHVNIVAHMLGTTLPGRAPFSTIEASLLASPPNIGVVIIITEQNFVRYMFRLAQKLYDIDNTIFIVPTVKAASEILHRQIGQGDRKRNIIDQLRSQDHATIQNALADLRQTRWLYDGTLQQADLRGARLHDVNLFMADLRGVDLSGADLQRANLFKVDFESADLIGVNFTGASIGDANLRNADLQDARLARAVLTGSDLRDANLRGADLTGTGLENVLLCGAYFDQHTILPDCHPWTSNEDIAYFLNYAALNDNTFD